MTLKCAALMLIAAVQDPSREPSREEVIRKVDAARVEEAIRKGVAWLYEQKWSRSRRR